MLDPINGDVVVSEIAQPNESKDVNKNVSYRGTDYERTPESDSFGGEKKNKTGKIIGITAGVIAAAALILGAVCYSKGKGADGVEKKFGERIKDGWKELWHKGEKSTKNNVEENLERQAEDLNKDTKDTTKDLQNKVNESTGKPEQKGEGNNKVGDEVVTSEEQAREVGQSETSLGKSEEQAEQTINSAIATDTTAKKAKVINSIADLPPIYTREELLKEFDFSKYNKFEDIPKEMLEFKNANGNTMKIEEITLDSTSGNFDGYKIIEMSSDTNRVVKEVQCSCSKVFSMFENDAQGRTIRKTWYYNDEQLHSFNLIEYFENTDKISKNINYNSNNTIERVYLYDKKTGSYYTIINYKDGIAQEPYITNLKTANLCVLNDTEREAVEELLEKIEKDTYLSYSFDRPSQTDCHLRMHVNMAKYYEEKLGYTAEEVAQIGNDLPHISASIEFHNASTLQDRITLIDQELKQLKPKQ